MPTSPAPFAIDKCYGSKLSVYGTQNKKEAQTNNE